MSTDREFVPTCDLLALRLLEVLKIDAREQPIKDFSLIMKGGDIAEVHLVRYVRRGELRDMIEELEKFDLKLERKGE